MHCFSVAWQSSVSWLERGDCLKRATLTPMKRVIDETSLRVRLQTGYTPNCIEGRETLSDRSGPSHSLATLQSLAVYLPDQRSHSAIDLHCQAQLITPREKRNARDVQQSIRTISHSRDSPISCVVLPRSKRPFGNRSPLPSPIDYTAREKRNARDI